MMDLCAPSGELENGRFRGRFLNKYTTMPERVRKVIYGPQRPKHRLKGWET